MHHLQAGEKPVLFFSVSGLRGTGRTTLYQKLKSTLPGAFPDIEFAFIGSPLGSLPLPLMWEQPEREKHATTRLFECWSRLNPFSIAKLRPNLKPGRIVISDGFGLDGLLYATAGCDCPKENAEAEDLHHQLVRSRIKTQDLPAPQYLLVQAAHQKVANWMLRSNPDLRESSSQLERERFIQHEERAIARYFQPENGQPRPFVLDATVYKMDALREQAERYIIDQFTQAAMAA